jgi:uncharacterized protein (DUF302 family)
MTKTILITHVTYTQKCDFDRFINNLEVQLGLHDMSAYQHLLGRTSTTKEIEAILKSQEGSSELMLFSSYDHGGLLSIKGASRKARQYVVGNPLYAARMTQHDIRAGLYAPLRLFVYTDLSDQVNVEYDLPSSLFGQFGNEQVTEVARELDQKLSSLINNAYKVALKA